MHTTIITEKRCTKCSEQKQFRNSEDNHALHSQGKTIKGTQLTNDIDYIHVN